MHPGEAGLRGLGGCIRNESVVTQGFATRKSIRRVLIASSSCTESLCFLQGESDFLLVNFAFPCPSSPDAATLCVLSQPVVSDSLRPHGLYPTRLLCPWNPCPGKNAGVGSHSLRQGIFPTQGLNPGPLPCGRLLQSSPDTTAWPWECELSQQGALCRAVPASGLSPVASGAGSRRSTQAWTPCSAESCSASANEDTQSPFWCGRLCLKKMPSLTLTVFSVFFLFEPSWGDDYQDPVANIWRAAPG
ncbi:unnamed protein product [Rangifer tarandus platyrhynchus]|uniref:Uncharacterized protein n=1 Tax=Rangifer tarandus platyrhynchus TaxID=3082113 RepID=A0AC59YPP0_RANTA